MLSRSGVTRPTVKTMRAAKACYPSVAAERSDIPMTATADPPTSPLPAISHPQTDAGFDYELFLDCVHCGLCLSSCPTYVELGTEMDSPRGRIYLMRAVTDGRVDAQDPEVRRHPHPCLDCRASEPACPSALP